MTQKKKTQFLIRAATPEDILRCLQLDHSLETQIVWQMKLQESDQLIQASFETLRLPRPIRVEYPRNPQELKLALAKGEGVLVAESEDILLGYVQIQANSADQSAWIPNLVVDEPWRRRQIGRALYDQACVWAVQLHKAHHMMLETTTRSYPAIRFMLARGLSFCGFNDRYYASQDIAVFFGQNI